MYKEKSIYKLKNIVFFLSGGMGYGLIELLWRGRTHWTMIIAGGLCFVIFSRIAERCRRNAVWKGLFCALSVTAVEFLFGIIFNLVFKMGVWDYSEMPLNILGQVCPLFSLAWWGLALAVLPLAEYMNNWFKEA